MVLTLEKKIHRKLLWRHHEQFWWCQNLRDFWHPYKTLANLCVFFQKIYHVDLICILRSGAESSFCTSYTWLVFLMTPGNVLCHHDRDLMGHFKFLHGSRMICLPLNISEKKIYIYIYWQHLFEKLGETEIIAFIFVNTIQRPCILRAISTIQVNGAQQHFFIRMTNLHLATLWSILPTKPMVWLVYFLSVLFQRWTYLLASEDSEKAM